MSAAVRPNLFIVGAAKCGTTSMYEYLARHPEVFMSAVKEPYYFGCDLDIAPYWRVRGESQYLALFEKASGEKRVGEGSVWYLCSHSAAEEIKSFNPDARIIIMLRNPVDMLYSLHGQFLRSYNESIFDFIEALAAEDDRRAGRRIPPSAHFPGGLQYRKVARFTGQIQRYLDVFGTDAVHVILFDDFTTDTAGVYRAALRFLEVDDSFQPEFDVHNRSSAIRTAPDRKFLKKRPKLKKFIERALPLPLRRGMGRVVESLFAPVQRANALDPKTRSALQAEFAGEVAALGRLLDRDLSHWCEPITSRR